LGLVAVTGALIFNAGCAGPKPAPAAAPAAASAPAASAAATTTIAPVEFAAGIPDRPEKLKFPAWEFQPPKASPYRVALTSGPVLYIAEERELPLVNISISIRTGDWVEPEGKEGLTDVCGGLLNCSGTEKRSAKELEERLAFLAARLSSSVQGAQGNVSLNLLSKDVDEGLTILREVLAQPLYQENRVDLKKQQVLQLMKQRNDDSATIEGIEADVLAYGEKFWDNRHRTADSVNSITRDDVLAFHHRWFFPSNFVVAVSGDFDRATMIAKLEQMFADWPLAGTPPPAISRDVKMAAPGVYLVDKSVNQGRVSLMLPGLMRDDPDYFPVLLMNDILGGSGFSSRLVNRVRSDEGLAYAVGSSFPGGVYFPTSFRASFQSKSGTVSFATSIVIEEIKRIAAEPVSAEELENSKRSFIDRLPRSFASKAQVVGMLASEEYTGRFQTDPNFWQNITARINAVTAAEVQRVAQKYLTPERLVILVVGDKDEILAGHPNHPVKLTDLGGGKFTELPLRDPLTMKPVSAEPK
jgi:zinc protease